jgi:hypothetical protein
MLLPLAEPLELPEGVLYWASESQPTSPSSGASRQRKLAMRFSGHKLLWKSPPTGVQCAQQVLLRPRVVTRAHAGYSNRSMAHLTDR